MVFSGVGAGAWACAWAAPAIAAATTNHFEFPISFSFTLRLASAGEHSRAISTTTTLAEGYRESIPGVGARETSGAPFPPTGGPIARPALHNVRTTAFV